MNKRVQFKDNECFLLPDQEKRHAALGSLPNAYEVDEKPSALLTQLMTTNFDENDDYSDDF